ncbi:type VI secretion system protein TssL [Chitinimonas arctica]|uniref:Type VI secretion system protein TssL n=1 Tax=Chitinimonas arctica TaxID=2594795 RepID=A0A516SBA6_9NEIS|nr:type VI secretion system protein TssL, long form [Chitinimonas arctica]QDQ25433.1 type VI secretion system protein TssL [Chitinimonas arctica]
MLNQTVAEQRFAPEGAEAAAIPAPFEANSLAYEYAELAAIQLGGLNPLVRAAQPLLQLVPLLRLTMTPPTMEALRGQLMEMTKTFVADCQQQRIAVELLATARYCLCTLLDEVISATPWGGGGAWASRSLLVTFHGEAAGGEQFFKLLQRLAQDPKSNIDGLELCYLILALGLQGRYRLVEGGRGELEQLRAWLRQLIRGQRGVPEAELSPQWRGVVDRRSPLLRMKPLWLTLGLATLAVVLLYGGLRWRLESGNDTLLAELQQIGLETPRKPVVAKPLLELRLAQLLAPEIAARLLSVQEGGDRSVVTLFGDGLFASGSAEVQPAYRPLLGRLTEALRTVPGRVVIAGHTDDRKLTSNRFGSNWQLSQARADAVLAILRQAGQPERFLTQGRGELEPLVANDSPANQARNRRVVITVLAPGAAL